MSVQFASWIAVAVFLADFIIRIGLSVRVIMRRRPVGVALAWLTVVLIFPFGGAILYLLIGEVRLGNRRAEWAARLHAPYEEWLRDLVQRQDVDWSSLGDECQALARLTETTAGIPALPGNELTFLTSTDEIFRAFIAEIDSAQRTCHLEFYIWHLGGYADDVAEALLRAAGRGVICRVLVDAVGSHEFLKSGLAARMREGGVHVQAALPANLIRGLFYRFDLRLHRKIVVIDGQVAYTGSLNMVDPRFFKQGAGVGQWIDAMVRVQGPAVEGLGITFLEDWELETREGVEELRKTGDVRRLEHQGAKTVQVVPSGPTMRRDAMQKILLMAIYSARRELVLTTPYFVPDELLMTALTSAANRGVKVTIVVPSLVDSLLVRFASQAHKGELLAAGVRVALFHGGLLHTKSITVDGQISLFGSVNLDPRSLWLNFEITLSIYDEPVTAVLRSLQQSYLDEADFLDLDQWNSRPLAARFTENVARLLSPLL